MVDLKDFNKIRDVNATKITPQDLSWDDLKMILDNSFDEIYVIDQNGKIIYVNNVSTLHYGFMADELIGQDYLYLQEKQCCTPPLVPIIMKEKKTMTMEQKTRTGKIITVTATPIFDHHGEVRMIIMNSRDISNIIALKTSLELKQKHQKQYKEAMLHYQSKNENGNMVAESHAMQMCLSLGKRVARFDTGILILGDSGVGKSLLAHYIHNESKRKNEPFITINCASIPKELLESELFGYVKGAFSGAHSKGKEGLAAVANKGTLFLDEIGEMPYNVQAKILQLVQEHTFIPLGGVKETGVDIKIIAATNQNLNQLVEDGLFRKDLYYRLDTIKIEIPSLKDRKEDILPLVNVFLDKYNHKYKTNIVLAASALNAFKDYLWPGNVRELEHIIERLILISDNEIIEVQDLPAEFLKKTEPTPTDSVDKSITPHLPTKDEEIRLIISEYLNLKSTYKVAKKLNISQSKVARIIKKFRGK